MAFGHVRLAPCLLASLILACSESAAPRFSDGDASIAADTTAAGCSASSQCDDGVACTRDICVVGGVCEHVPDGPMCMPAMRCTRAADCNDNVACTRDTCLVGGTCGHTAQNDLCPAGQACDATRGCSSGAMPGMCRTEADCRDMFECTVDACGADGRCVYTAQNARCAMGQVCRVGMGCISERSCSADADCDDRMRCNGAERCVEFGCVAGAAVTCDDMNPCTRDACVEGGDAGMCTHAPEPSCTTTVRSGEYVVTVPAMFACAADQVNVRLERFLFSVSGTSLSVTPAPRGPGMMGMIAGSTFSVRADVGSGPFACIESYQLTGTFSDADHFTGTYTVSFAPAILCGFYPDCVMRTFPIEGTARR